ncbi:type IV toxin-antitoxin system AbiEi family antitoxin domain-containing protein [Adlercreutzia sp. ZJ473]|uniref:type IV toxin-antitoxin system AbiEi family antitoxin domain-containing protein n=1 Tax=Adlercreutzia sp. ZJ473 TaxID=2722822 RepID=UPI001552A57D|nr:type IV toxin-antitoxin system AbiEi family antitoxin domain-containing protein [Adlercreutzia sp. ZJ473]
MSKRGNIQNVYDLAAGQWGLLTSAQAIDIGISRTQLNRMSADRRLEPICYGVYRVAAGEETINVGAKAAWLSLYPKKTAYERLGAQPHDAVATGRTAAWMHGCGDFHASPYCFAVAREKRSARTDLELLHDVVDERDVTLSFGIPTATIERTVADLVRLHEDPSLVDGFMSDAAASGHLFDEERLSDLLSPLSKENGFASGGEFARHLIEKNAAHVATARAISDFAKAVMASGAFDQARHLSESMRDTMLASLSQLSSEMEKIAPNTELPTEALLTLKELMDALAIPHSAIGKDEASKSAGLLADASEELDRHAARADRASDDVRYEKKEQGCPDTQAPGPSSKR